MSTNDDVSSKVAKVQWINCRNAKVSTSWNKGGTTWVRILWKRSKKQCFPCSDHVNTLWQFYKASGLDGIFHQIILREFWAGGNCPYPHILHIYCSASHYKCQMLLREFWTWGNCPYLHILCIYCPASHYKCQILSRVFWTSGNCPYVHILHICCLASQYIY